jgi:predicted nucleic acid-binding protein
VTAPRVFVDTNVFVYLFDAGAPAKQARARELVGDTGLTICVSPQVLSECYVTLTRKFAAALSEADAEAVIRSLAEFQVIRPGADTVLDAIGLSRVRKLSFWDAMIVETALAGGCERLLSEDLQAGQTFRSLSVTNPFKR